MCILGWCVCVRLFIPLRGAHSSQRSKSLVSNIENELFVNSGQSRDRTGDTRIFSPVLYQLSYLSVAILQIACGSVE